MKLSLTLKKKWYRLIEQGIKKEDYREIKPWWNVRIWGHKDEITEVSFSDYVHSMTFEVENISIGKPKEGWADITDKDLYIIHLGKRIR